MEVEMTQEATTFTLLDGSPLTLVSDGESFTVNGSGPVVVPVALPTVAGQT
jgi:hypothetical protein